MAIAPNLRLQGQDRLAMAAPAEELASLWTVNGLVPVFGSLAPKERYLDQLVELVVSPKSLAVGRLISELPLPGSPFQARLVGVSHDGQGPEGPLGEYRVQAGDAAMLEVDDAFSTRTGASPILS